MLKIFRSKFKKQKSLEADEMLHNAKMEGRKNFLMQEIISMKIGGEVRDAISQKDLDLLEFMFMWGWFFAYAKRDERWPTSPDQRATLHLVSYLVEHHAMELSNALIEGRNLDKLYNQADIVFDAVRARGENAFENPDSAEWAAVLQGYLRHFQR